MHTTLEVFKPGNLHPLFRKKSLTKMKDLEGNHLTEWWKISISYITWGERKAAPLSLRTGRKGKENGTFSLQKHPVLLKCVVLPVNFVMPVLTCIAWYLQGKVIKAKSVCELMKEKWQQFPGKKYRKSIGHACEHEIKRTACRIRAISVIFLWKCYQVLHQGLA